MLVSAAFFGFEPAWTNQVSLIGQSLSGGDELLQARERRDVFVVALFGGRAAGGAVASAEPVARRSPTVRARHVDAVPDALPVGTSVDRRHGVDDRVGPVQIRQDAVIRLQDFRWWTAVASVGPQENRRVRAQHLDLRAQAVPRDPVVLVVPLRPLLPLVAAHPAEHQRDAHLVGHLDDAFAGELALQSQHVQAEILDVAQRGGIACGIVGEQQVGRVRRTANQEVPAVDLQIEAAAGAEFRELVVLIAMLCDGADSEPLMVGVGGPVELAEFQLQVVEVGLAEGVRPPEVGIGDRKRAESCGVERDLPVLPRGEGDRLFDLDVRLAWPADRGAKDAADLLRRSVAQAAVDRQVGGIGSRQRKFRVHRTWGRSPRRRRP